MPKLHSLQDANSQGHALRTTQEDLRKELDFQERRYQALLGVLVTSERGAGELLLRCVTIKLKQYTMLSDDGNMLVIACGPLHRYGVLLMCIVLFSLCMLACILPSGWLPLPQVSYYMRRPNFHRLACSDMHIDDDFARRLLRKLNRFVYVLMQRQANASASSGSGSSSTQVRMVKLEVVVPCVRAHVD